MAEFSKIGTFCPNLVCPDYETGTREWKQYYKIRRHPLRIGPHKMLRRKNKDVAVCKWIQRTPATAAGLTDHIWTLKELFTTVIAGKQHSAG